MLVVSAGVHVLSPGQKVTIYQSPTGASMAAAAAATAATAAASETAVKPVAATSAAK